MDEGIDALCSVAKVSPSLLQRLGCKCWDVIHISLVAHLPRRRPRPRHEQQQHHHVLSSSSSKDDDDDDVNWSLLTSFIVQVIPDELCSSHQLCIHPVLLDFLHAAAAESSSALLSRGGGGGGNDTTTSITPITLPGSNNREEEHPNKDHDDDSQKSAPPIVVQLSSFTDGPSFHQHDDDDDYDENHGGDFTAEHHQHHPQYQWQVQKAATATAPAIRQLDNGSTLVVQGVYSDAPIIILVDQNNDDSSINAVNGNDGTFGFFFSGNDLAAALEDRLVQKGCIIVLPVVASCMEQQAHHKQQQQQEGHHGGYVIALIQDICLPPHPTTTTTDNSDDVSYTGDAYSDHHSCRQDNVVYRLGTRDCFQLSILASSLLRGTTSSTQRHATAAASLWTTGVLADESNDYYCNDDGDASDCPGYESLQQQLVQLLDPSVNSSSSSSSSFCRLTGVLLTGSVGVGKTRLAKCVARQLSSSSSSNRKKKVHWISLQDVLMQTTTTPASTTLKDLTLILLPPFTNILMIDDLHVLAATEDGGETEQDISSFPDMDRQLLQSALLQVIDASVEQGIPCLGIASTEWKLLPTILVKFGRFEKQLEMSSPTQHQREMILQKQLGDIRMMPTSTTSLTPPVDEYNNIKNKAKHWASIWAPLTAGCVAADLCRLCHNAQMRSWARQQQVNGDYDDDDVAVSNLGSSIRSEAPLSFSLPPPPLLLWEDLRDAAQELVPFQLATLDVIKPAPVYDKSGSILMDRSSSSSTTRKDVDDWLAIHEQSWYRLAGYAAVKKRVYRTIVAPWRRFLKHEHQKRSYNNDDDNGGNVDHNDYDGDEQNHKLLLIPPPTGVIFHGASGSGKTVAATCLGASLEWSMIHVNVATDILDQWLGGSEAALRSLFARARAAAPCILFLDEMDAIACNRNNSDNGDSTNVMSRLLSTLLNEMDGIGGSSSLPSKVLVVACTNQPLDSIDAALLRPGRLDHHVELKTPVTLDDAVTILQLYLTRKNIKSIDQRKHENAHEQTAPAAAAAACTHSLLHDEVDLQVIAGRALQGPKLSVVTGASLEGLARQAILSALQRSMADVSKGHDSDEVIQVTMQDFDEALSRV